MYPRHCRSKRKLLVVVGAGASVDFGMPTTAGVADLLSAEAEEHYPLFEDHSSNLYKYFDAAVAADWQMKEPQI